MAVVAGELDFAFAEQSATAVMSVTGLQSFPVFLFASEVQEKLGTDEKLVTARGKPVTSPEW
jgi:hypothetical protein